MALTDAQYAAFIDRLIACREAEDAAKEDTKAVYAELADAGEDKTVAGLVVRQRRMTAKDRVKAELRDAAAEDGHSRYLRGKASHVRAREDDHSSDVRNMVPDHDADTGEIIEDNSSQAVAGVSHALASDGPATPSAGTGGDEDRQPISTPDSPIGEDAGEAETGETLSASPAVNQAETPNEAAGELVASGLIAADHGTDTWGGWSAEELSPGGEDVASPPAHAPEQPGNDHGSVNPPAEGGAHSAPISQPVSEAPSLASADRSGGHPAPSSSLQADPAPVTTPTDPVDADRTKPHPWCQDPEDCGVEASWNHMCGSCLRRRSEREAARALQ